MALVAPPLASTGHVALLPNGSNGYVNIAGVTAGSPPAGYAALGSLSAFTLTARVLLRSSIAAGASKTVLVKHSNTEYTLDIRGGTSSADAIFRTQVRTVNGGAAGTTYTAQTAAGTAIPDTEHSLVATWSGSSNRLRMYIDGMLAQTTTTAGATTSPGNQVNGTENFSVAALVGVSPTFTVSRFTNMEVRDVSVYNREFSGGEVLDWTRGAAIPSTTGLLLYWPMTEGTGTTVIDQGVNHGGANELDGTLQGSPLPAWVQTSPLAYTSLQTLFILSATQPSPNPTLACSLYANVDFVVSGTIGTSTISPEYSTDGGATWTALTLQSGATTITVNGTYTAVLPTGTTHVHALLTPGGSPSITMTATARSPRQFMPSFAAPLDITTVKPWARDREGSGIAAQTTLAAVTGTGAGTAIGCLGNQMARVIITGSPTGTPTIKFEYRVDASTWQPLIAWNATLGVPTDTTNSSTDRAVLTASSTATTGTYLAPLPQHTQAVRLNVSAWTSAGGSITATIQPYGTDLRPEFVACVDTMKRSRDKERGDTLSQANKARYVQQCVALGITHIGIDTHWYPANATQLQGSNGGHASSNGNGSSFTVTGYTSGAFAVDVTGSGTVTVFFEYSTNSGSSWSALTLDDASTSKSYTTITNETYNVTALPAGITTIRARVTSLVGTHIAVECSVSEPTNTVENWANVAQEWANEVRKYPTLGIWWRGLPPNGVWDNSGSNPVKIPGNAAQTNYTKPPGLTPPQYLAKTVMYIQDNPGLFAPGDIWDVSEPNDAGYWDQLYQDGGGGAGFSYANDAPGQDTRQEWNKFFIDSMVQSQLAFESIGVTGVAMLFSLTDGLTSTKNAYTEQQYNSSLTRTDSSPLSSEFLAFLNGWGWLGMDSYPEGSKAHSNVAGTEMDTTDPLTNAKSRTAPTGTTVVAGGGTLTTDHDAPTRQLISKWGGAVRCVCSEVGFNNAADVTDTLQQQTLNAEFFDATYGLSTFAVAGKTYPTVYGINYWVGPGTSGDGGFTYIISGAVGSETFRPAATEFRNYAWMMRHINV